VILDRPIVTAGELERRTGWAIKPGGACKGDRCVPLPETSAEGVGVEMLADRLGMALVHAPEHGLWALGPDSGGKALLSAELPDVSLPDRKGQELSLRSLRGLKVLLVAWASW
jgi:hypothetical protein